MTVGIRIKHRRSELGWSRLRLSKETGIPVTTLASLEQGDTQSSRSIVRISAALGVDALWLSAGVGDSPAAASHGCTNEAKQLLAIYRILSPANQKLANRIIRGLAAGGEP